MAARDVGYAIKVPFYRWLDLQRYIRDTPTWVPVAPGVTGFAVPRGAMADPRGREYLSEEGPPPGHQELSARPVPTTGTTNTRR